MRRLPVYLLLDTSGSMRGERIEAVKNGIQVLLSKLRQDPYALESVWLSIITFDREVKLIAPLTPLENFITPDITTPESGPTNMGAALLLLCERLKLDIRTSTTEEKGDWRPLLFIMTDGKPSDLAQFREATSKIKQQNFATIVACAAGVDPEESYLKDLTYSVVHLDLANSNTLVSFFRWVSDSIGIGNRTLGTSEELILPPPPSEINMII